jgi:hypothetical protein
VWTVQQYLVRPRAVLRCSLCGTERIGNHVQAKAGLMRCWTCRPKPPPAPRKPKAPKAPRPSPSAPPASPEAPDAPKPPRVPAPAATPLSGRIATSTTAYSRALRYQIEDEGEIQHGRIEIAGARTVNPLNKRLTWQATKGTSEAVKRVTMAALDACVARPHEGHFWSYELKLSRVSTKLGLDDDGVTAALKAVRDAFAIFVRINDSNRRFLRVSYGIGHARVQGIVLEWSRFYGPLDHEDDAASAFLFFEEDELDVLAAEHRVTRRYWKERMEKRLVSIAARPAALTVDDEEEEEAAYDIAEEDEG